MFWATVSLFIVGAVASPVDEKSKPSAKTFEVEEAGANRDEKLFSVFQIVKFNNEECTGSSGDTGTCYTAAECSALSGGAAQGSCASGFGVCCVTTLDPCDGTTSAVNFILNFDVANKPADCTSDNTDTSSASGRSSYRQSRTTIEYDYLIQKQSSSIVQLRFDFEKVELQGPTNGECTNDTITIEHADKGTMKYMPTNLCGTITGSHLYADFREEDEIDVRIRLSSEIAQNWRIRVRQLEESDDYYAPRGCLQYHRTDTTQTGTIMSFNNDAGNGELLNNPAYTICLQHNTAYCDAELTATDFDLSGNNGNCLDTIAFGTRCLCGSSFGNMNMLTWNYTGSYHVDVMTDDDNSAMVSGFNIGYMLLSC